MRSDKRADHFEQRQVMKECNQMGLNLELLMDGKDLIILHQKILMMRAPEVFDVVHGGNMQCRKLRLSEKTWDS